MANDDMLSEFLDDAFFKQTITLITRSITYSRGRVVSNPDEEVQVDGIIQSVDDKELINLGLGQYTDKLSYCLHTQTPIDQSENNLIRYEGKLFKILRTSPWNSYGFNRYVLYQYNEDVVNDN